MAINSFGKDIDFMAVLLGAYYSHGNIYRLIGGTVYNNCIHGKLISS
ncbi:MAG TPA: hypothetical protein VKA95_13540 [Nitrososphaeraceae archaeon]|nr:hypothetical protein [Nitrososphaeraceae archaeon]